MTFELYVSSTSRIFGIRFCSSSCLTPGDVCRIACQTLITIFYISHINLDATATKAGIFGQPILWDLDISIDSTGPTAIYQHV